MVSVERMVNGAKVIVLHGQVRAPYAGYGQVRERVRHYVPQTQL